MATKKKAKKKVAKKKVTKKKAVKKVPAKLGNLMTKFLTLKEQQRKVSAKLDDIKTLSSAVALELAPLMKKAGLETASNAKGSINFKELDLGQVTNYKAFHKFIVKHDAWHLLGQSINQASYREYLEAGKKFSFIKPFTKDNITYGLKRGVKK